MKQALLAALAAMLLAACAAKEPAAPMKPSAEAEAKLEGIFGSSAKIPEVDLKELLPSASLVEELAVRSKVRGAIAACTKKCSAGEQNLLLAYIRGRVSPEDAANVEKGGRVNIVRLASALLAGKPYVVTEKGRVIIVPSGQIGTA